MGAMSQLKKLKHRSLIVRKRIRFYVGEARDAIYRSYTSVAPWRFDSSRYPLDFVALPDGSEPLAPSHLPERIWCIWFGRQAMSKNRQAAYESILKSNADLDVVLVTEDNLNDYIVDHSPLHPAFPWLSSVHQSDYVRAYLLHHHGGGYTDVKKHSMPWKESFRRLALDDSAWVAGYRLPRVAEATWFYGPLARDIHRNYARLVGYGAMLARSHTPLTRAWVDEVERRLSYYRDLLEKFPGNDYGDNQGYPVPWTALGSQVFEPLCFKYNDRVRIDSALKPQLWGHR